MPDSQQIIPFQIADREYALPVQSVRQILRPRTLCPVPRAPAPVLGAFAWRGDILPLLDLRRGMGPHAPGHSVPTEATRYLLVAEGAQSAAIWVDRVLAPILVSADNLQPLSSALDDVPEGLIAGVFQVEDRLLLMLRLSRLFYAEGKEPQAT